MWKSRVELVKRFCVTTLVREREGRGNKRELTPSDEGEGLKSGNFKPNVASAYVSVFTSSVYESHRIFTAGLRTLTVHSFERVTEHLYPKGSMIQGEITNAKSNRNNKGV